MFAFPIKPRRVAEVWHDAWLLFTQEFKNIWVFALVATIIGMLGTYWSIFSGQPPVHHVANHTSFLPASFFHSPIENGLISSMVLVILTLLVDRKSVV